MDIPGTLPVDPPEKPWEKRLRVVPLRTYSGTVKYPKSKHYFTPSDVERITKNMFIQPDTREEDWETRLIRWLQGITIRMLEKTLPFLSSDTTHDLYYMIYEMLGRIFKVDTSLYTGGNPPAEEVLTRIIEEIAASMGRGVIISPPRR